MKYIAVFDVPDGYAMGCAIGKVAQKGKDYYEDKDFKNLYAQIEPLPEEKSEILEKYNTVIRVMDYLGMTHDVPSFWAKEEYGAKYHQGYMQALEDVEKEIRKRVGFSAERDVIFHVFKEGMYEETR